MEIIDYCFISRRSPFLLSTFVLISDMASRNNTLMDAQYRRYLENAEAKSKYYRSDVMNFRIRIDRDSHRQLLTPFEPGGVHKFSPYAENN
jgi:hypothetical protein